MTHYLKLAAWCLPLAPLAHPAIRHAVHHHTAHIVHQARVELAAVIAPAPCVVTFAAAVPSLPIAPVAAARVDALPITLPDLTPTAADTFAALSPPGTAGPSQGIGGGSFTQLPGPPVAPPGSVPAVPEPPAWAQLVAGFAVAGGVVRGHRRVA